MRADDQAEFLTTWFLPESPEWAARCEMLDRRSMSRATLIRRIVRGARGKRAAILDGSAGPEAGYTDLLAAIELRRRPRRWQVPTVIGECQWKLEGAGLDRIATRMGLR